LTASAEDWDLVLNVDLKGVFFCAQAAAPHMIRQAYGKIVNISSALGTGTTPHNTAGSPAGSAAYASAKAGVIQLTKTLARELGPHGIINVNCVAPGTFLTPITSSTRTPEEVAEHIAYRTVHEDVDPAICLDDLAHEPLDLRAVRDIDGKPRGLTAARFDVFHGRRYCALILLGNDDQSAFRREAIGNRLADTRGSPCYAFEEGLPCVRSEESRSKMSC
jgi:NAD(P)-dependent dehydrogenase (short-subunit alcohol dehydrogenase family)